MGYSDDLDKAIKHGLDDLINYYKSSDEVFNQKKNLDYYEKYLEIIKN